MKQDLEDKQPARSDVAGLYGGGESLVQPPLMQTSETIFIIRTTLRLVTCSRGHQDQERVDDGVDEAGADLPPLDGGQANVGRAVGGVGD